MCPPADLPPPPPAIHAPVPARTVQNTVPLNAMNARTIQVLNSATARSPIDKQPGVFTHFRYMHIKHHRGTKHKSQKARSNKRKAARRK
jgi:hypothetical protein